MSKFNVEVTADFFAPNIAAAQYVLYVRSEPIAGETFKIASRSLERPEGRMALGFFSGTVEFSSVDAASALAATLLIGTKLAAGYAPGTDPNGFYFRKGSVYLVTP